MKLLKIVLIALVTFGIYSFTTNENRPEFTKNDILKIDQYDGCFSLMFNTKVTNEQKRLARLWITKTYNIELVNLKESTLINDKIQEKWDYIINRTKVDVQEDDDDKEDEWKTAYIYLYSYSLGCQNSFTHILN